MRLSKAFQKAVLGGLLTVTALAGLTGCGAEKIGPANTKNPDLQGITVSETLPQSGAEIQRIHLDGSKLEAGKHYEFNGTSLTIEGDVPAGTHISGKGGQIIVTGSVGEKAEIKVSVSEFYHMVPRTCTGIMPAGKVMVPYTYSCPRRVDDGPMPPFNQDPTIIVHGTVGQKASLQSSYGTTIVVPR